MTVLERAACPGCGHMNHPANKCEQTAYITKERCRCPYDNGTDPRIR